MDGAQSEEVHEEKGSRCTNRERTFTARWIQINAGYLRVGFFGWCYSKPWGKFTCGRVDLGS